MSKLLNQQDDAVVSAPSKLASNVPTDPDALLTRPQTAAALTEAGYPTAAATLASMATRGGGPPYQRYGPRVLYRWGSALQWAQSRLSAPVHSTSELMSRARQSISDLTEAEYRGAKLRSAQPKPGAGRAQ
jgi:hypothetical protein